MKIRIYPGCVHIKKTGNRINPFMKFIFISLILLISACYSTRFSSENVMKLKVGMSDAEVVAIFGYPSRTSANTCGQGLGKPWTCIHWYYGKWTPKLTFQQNTDGSLSLNGWDIGTSW